MPTAELIYRQAITRADCHRAFSLMVDPTGTHDYATQYEHHQSLRPTNQPGGEKFWLVEQQEPGAYPASLVAMQLLQIQADRSATIWPPVCRTDLQNREPIRKKLMRMVITEAKLAGCQLLQSFTELDEEADRLLLEQNGLPYIADLLVLHRPSYLLPTIDPVRSVAARTGCPAKLVSIGPHYEASELAHLIERTYEKSADFPELIGQKTGLHSLATHQQQGIYNPQYWYWIEVAGTRVGVLLLTYHRDQAVWEMIYLGIIPEFRRQGISRYVMATLLSNEEIQKQGIRVGVDARNSPAIRLYESSGFVLQSRQSIHFCWLAEQKKK